MPDTRNILIVEDEPLIAMMVEDYLDLLGHRVAGSCDNVADALAMVAGGDIDAALLDVNLRSGEKSFAVADALAQAGIPFVFATGGSGDSIEEAHRDAPTLSKPFTLDGLEAALGQL